MRSPPPLPLALSLACLLGVAGSGGCKRDSSGSPAKVPPTTGARDAGVGTLPVTPPPPTDPRLAGAEALYKSHCALCHGATMMGYAADNAPSLVNPTFLASADDSFLSRSIELGRPGTAMAGYGRDVGGPLDDAQIASLIALFRSKGPPLQALAPVPGGGDVARGAAIYNDSCKKCHGDPTVRGTAPHLANPVFITVAKDDFIAHAIRNGRPGTPMEKFPLADQQVADVIALLRSWAPSKPVTPPVTPPPPPPENGPVVINPKGKPPSFTLREDRFVPADEVKAALDAKRRMVLIDARPPSDWTQMHITGSISIPHYEAAQRIDRVPNDGTWVVAYCACPHHASGEVVDELRRRGYKNTAVLEEGIRVWIQRGYPTQGESAEALRKAAPAAPVPPPPPSRPPPPSPSR
jgi:mono/diheme cytochrome c family protein/rhodanese-related sulfurtransferase